MQGFLCKRIQDVSGVECHQVQQLEKYFCGGTIIPQVYLSRVDGVFADEANIVQGLLDTLIKPVRYKPSNIIIDTLARLTQLFAEFLNG